MKKVLMIVALVAAAVSSVAEAGNIRAIGSFRRECNSHQHCPSGQYCNGNGTCAAVRHGVTVNSCPACL